MRKLTILLAVAALAASSTGCCGRLRNLFHKGSPCGTVMAPAMIGAPVAMSSPVMTTPCMQAPACCVPCDPCADPCSQGVSTGYFGSYVDGGSSCGCAGGGETTFVPSASAPAAAIPTYPGPGGN